MSVLKAERVSKFFGDFPALRDLTFQFEAGDCVALLGRNGAGKTPANIDIDAWLSKVNLLDVADAPLREYSRGMRQRLALARVFMGTPELLLLDEPFTSLDDKATALLQTLLAEALARRATVVLSTHQIPEAMVLASRILFLEHGKLAYFGPRPEEMLGDSTWIYRTYGANA